MHKKTTLAGLFLLGIACQNAHPAPAAVSQAALIERGRQLVMLGGCADCHTPKAFDPKLKMPVPQQELALSGHPERGPEPQSKPGVGDTAVIGGSFTSFATPFGVVYAANLTPDRETGLGTWSEDDFVKTLRSGHEKGTGRPILPPMPWQNLASQPDADLRAMYAYLHSIRPVKNRVPAPNVPPPVIAAIGATYPKPAEAVN